MTIYGERLALANAKAWLYPGAFAPAESRALYRTLYEQLDWQESAIRLFGPRVKSPRLSVWYGDKPYTYSGLSWPVRPWQRELVEIRQRVEGHPKYQWLYRPAPNNFEPVHPRF